MQIISVCEYGLGTLKWVCTLARTREQHLWLQPDHPVSVHGCCGCGVGQTDQVLPLLLLHRAHSESKSYEASHLQVNNPCPPSCVTQPTHLVDVQGNNVSADLRLWSHHGRLLHLLPVGSQISQPQVVVNKLKAVWKIIRCINER